MLELVLATRNEHKVRELEAMLEGWDVLIWSLDDFPSIPPVVEDGETFAANALKKAREVAKATRRPAMADDSGLEVDSLGGKPGVYSARFAGEDASSAANNVKLLQLLTGKEGDERRARFRSVIAVVTPEGREWLAEGSCEGLIAKEPRGEGGFGYDPLFIVPEYGLTFAELPSRVKNSISHRARAMEAAKPLLKQALGITRIPN